jgi:hypothetical protein
LCVVVSVFQSLIIVFMLHPLTFGLVNVTPMIMPPMNESKIKMIKIAMRSKLSIISSSMKMAES